MYKLLNRGISTQLIIIVILAVAVIAGAVFIFQKPESEEQLSEEATEEFCSKPGTEEKLSLTEAKQIAVASECGENLEETYICNEDTGTWWIDLTIESELCNPACVINVITKEAEINWRCTGVISEPDSNTEKETTHSPEPEEDVGTEVECYSDSDCDDNKKCVSGNCILKSCSEMGGNTCIDREATCPEGKLIEVSMPTSQVCCSSQCEAVPVEEPEPILCELVTTKYNTDGKILQTQKHDLSEEAKGAGCLAICNQLFKLTLQLDAMTEADYIRTGECRDVENDQVVPLDNE